jgi:predicted membrane protein
MDHKYAPRRRSLKLLGWTVLLLGLPLALMAAFHQPNEYDATLGINALDCDGPFGTYMFAIPALLLYGAGLAINGMRWRNRINLVLALVCLLICGAVIVNVTQAVAEEREQEAKCLSR